MGSSFKSYVGLEEYEMKIQGASSNGEMLQPQFLPGELIIAEAANVLKFTSLNKKKGLSGSLFVTNARLVFVSSDQKERSEDSVPLLSINTLCLFENSSSSGIGKKAKRRVKLQQSNSPSNTHLFFSGTTRIYEILIICSNFRTLRISFKFSPIDHGQRIYNSIIHHSFPDKLERLFYFDYCEAQKNDRSSYVSFANGTVPYYSVQGDWLREIKRTRIFGRKSQLREENSGFPFRLSDANENFSFCLSLPEWILVPSALSDVRLISLAEKMKGCRPPFLVWGDYCGGCIIRMARLNHEGDSPAENAFFELIRKSHPKKLPPLIRDLEEPFPLKDIHNSFNKLLEISCPESFSQYEETDSRFYSLIDQSKWLFWISKILRISGEVAESIASSSSVVILQEHESRDMSCVISSIAQILLDTRFRTVTGLFTLIQKEWISFGHPFRSNMQSSPLFLLFLDSLFQLTCQNPMDFEFNEQLLHDIWDSTFDTASGSFLFDSPGQRKKMEVRRDFNFWNRILTKEEILPEASNLETDYPLAANKITVRPSPSSSGKIPPSLLNPMYKLKPLLYPPSADGVSSSMILCSSLMCDIIFWHSLYLSRNDEIPPRTIDPLDRIISSPMSKPNSRLKPSSPPNSKGSNSSSETSPYRSTSFVFNSHIINPEDPFEGRSGQNPLYELKLVELLLNALSMSTRYQRSGGATAGSSRSSNKSYHQNATITKGNVVVSPSTHTHNRVVHKENSRKNPFNLNN